MPRDETTMPSRARQGLRSCAANVARSLALLERSAKVIERSRATLTSSDALGVSDAVGVRLEQLATESSALRAALKSAVYACVEDLKAGDVPPEEVLVLVKEEVGSAVRSTMTPPDANHLIGQTVQWAIDAYYPAA